MSRFMPFLTLVLAVLAGRAEAIEMFTNFHNGENIGFPPMQVPPSVYGGFGRGGWNPHSQGMPLKTNPPVPAMMPTGQAPARHVFNYYGEASNVGPNAAVSANSGKIESGYQPELVGDRRRGRWQRTEINPSDKGNSINEAVTPQSSSNDKSSSRQTTSSIMTQPGQSSSSPGAMPTILRPDTGELPQISESQDNLN